MMNYPNIIFYDDDDDDDDDEGMISSINLTFFDTWWWDDFVKWLYDGMMDYHLGWWHDLIDYHLEEEKNWWGFLMDVQWMYSFSHGDFKS